MNTRLPPAFCLLSLGLSLTACTGDTDTTDKTDEVTDSVTDITGTKESGDTADSSDTGTPDLCNNDVIDKGESCDGAELGGATCADVDTFVDGALGCTKACEFDTTKCITASQWIADARAAADGKVSLPIAKAIVTNVREAVGSDPAGFFIQSEMAGPALYVSVDPTTLKPVPVEGDEVSFTITEMATVFQLRHASAIDAFSVDGNVGNVASLLQNLTASSTVVDDLDDLESELLSFEATLISDFGFAGSDHIQAEFSTSGYPKGNENLTLRLSSALADEIDLVNGCAFSVESNMWRFNVDAQLGLYSADDITFTSCPDPTVESASATTSTTVVVAFDRHIDSATVDPTDFTFDNGLTTVSVDSVVGRVVTLTTSAQTAGQTYTVTAATLDDTIGGTVDPAANTATFVGYQPFLSQLYISEVDGDTPGTDMLEFVEVWNNTGGSVDLDGYYLVFLNGDDNSGKVLDGTYDAIALTGTLAANDVIVAGNSGVANVDITFANNFVQNGQDGIILASCPKCTDVAKDFPDDSDVGTKTTWTTGGGAIATKVDAVVHHTGDEDDKVLWDKLLVTAQWDENANGNQSGDSISRISVTAFQAGKPTPGSH